MEEISTSTSASASASGYKEYVAGLIAGVATVAIGHPFDTVKVKLQKHNTGQHVVRYRSGLHCTTRILKTEGGGVQSGEPQPQVIIPSAAYGGAIISFVLCPTELVKCRMQIQGTDSLVPKSSRYSSPLDCALKTVKSEGVTGIFRGGFTTLLRESIGNAVFFSTYEYVRYHLHSHAKAVRSNYNNLVDIGIGIITGGLGGVSFWLAVLPLDVAKTLIQTNPEKNCSRNPFQVLSSVYRSGGLKGCYTGLGPTVTRAFPANAAAIVTWELAMKMLGIRHD
ncbi:mitochondrial arginine transporter BAC1 isoform X2 [Arachis duranensis]|uniref:Mitochondrial arginine transporter BAC1 isoform X2 n=1 Tax=Arachis duranensis TaxID=130453 RepID=A0A6P4CS62_ARADU|nr:mitochondrial arginine transporter BAC1 isoform X2 [Arachis duranensis]